MNRNLTGQMGGFGGLLRVAASSNPPINRNCNSPLRGLPQSGYWQRYAADKHFAAAKCIKFNFSLHNA